MQSNEDTAEAPGCVYSGETKWEDWYVTSHWFLFEDQVIPAGIDVRSFQTLMPGGTPWEGAGYCTWASRPQTATRGLFARLPLGQILRDHRREAWQSLMDDPDWADVAPLMEAPAKRTSPRDALYRSVALFYAEALRRGERAPAEFVRAQLEFDPERYGVARELDPERPETDKRVRVRKWIAAARKRDLIPPLTGETDSI
jgi:hypothetical protein